jgi:cyclic lactone autoinducer peptide
MKKLFEKVLKGTVKAAECAARTSAGLASFGGMYQPKEPKGLKK